MKSSTKENENVLITGTTSGVGRALMDYYARRSARVIAVNRRSDPELESLFPQVKFYKINVQDSQAIAGLIASLAAEKNLPTTFILNAGINKVDNDGSFSLDDFRETIQTNLFGALNFVAPLTARAPELPMTRIVAISSMINYAANPYCLGYYTSKRALTQSFEVFYEMYRNTRLQFKWVVLGPVPTEIVSSSDKFPKIMSRIKDLFSVSVEKTAAAIARFSGSNRHALIFPFKARLLFRAIWLVQRLIPGFYRERKQDGTESREP